MNARQRIERLARRSHNFGFLLVYQPLLVAYGAGAEMTVFTDPNAAFVKERQFVEVLTQELIARFGLRAGGRLVDRIRALSAAGALTAQVERDMHRVRDVGNVAVHPPFLDDVKEALTCLRLCFEMGAWFARTINGDRDIRTFVPPTPPPEVDPEEVTQLADDLQRYRQELAEAHLRLEGKESRLLAEMMARQEAETLVERARQDRDEALELVSELEQQLAELRAAEDTRFERLQQEPRRVSAAARELLVERARQPGPLNEAQARRVIDRMLVEAGWVLQSMDELDPHAGVGVAVREFPLPGGFADYVLYVDGMIVGVIEAKREGVPLTGVEWQTGRYARGLPQTYAPAAWRADEPLPFRYESTGTETQFTNGLDPEPRSREIFSFHRPGTLARWMREAEEEPAAATLRARFRRLPALIVEDLRPAQIDAVERLERSLARSNPRALIQMATGAGKTYAAVTASYRLLKHAKAHRILFLVDRNNLGRQARGELRNYVTPDDGRKFTELYNVELLSGAAILESSKVVISTIQRMYSLLRGQELPDVEDDNPDFDEYEPSEPVEVAYNPAIPPETFDLIIIDECHRSIYGKWRAVLEYFDAHLVGLTATPVKQTFGFFHQNLVSEYTYEQAVADGVNVDFDVYRIRTKMTERGETIEAGTVVPIRDRRTRRQRYEELEDDFTYTGSQIGRSVIAEGQIRLVLETFRDRLFTEIFSGRNTVPKTLIFAKDDNHAEEIVRQVREIFGKGNDFAAKITYTARREGKNPDSLIQAFRNSPELRVAVTVDMIATGTDVRPIECVFFLRDVKSVAYFEQMKGRGARTIDATQFQAVTPDATAKERFMIIDAVGVTDNPLVEATPLQRHSERQINLEKLLAKTASLAISVDEASTLASRLARLDRQLNDDERDEIERVGNMPLRDLVKGLVRAVDTDTLEAARVAGGEQAIRRLIVDAVRPLTTNPELCKRLLEIRRAHDITIDEVNRDLLVSAARLAPEARAKLTIRSWHEYLEQHKDEAAVHHVLANRRGGRGTYAPLKELAERIKRPPYEWTPDGLWRAYVVAKMAAAQPGMQHGVTELISLIRYELGADAELRPYRATIEERFQAWLLKQEQAGVQFTPAQLWWLERIRDVIATSAEISPEDLDHVPFTERGGTDGFEATFGSTRAAKLIDELDQELTA